MDTLVRRNRIQCILALVSCAIVVVCVCIGVTMNLTTLYDEDFDEEITYSIVGSNQADPLEQKISDQSPIGRALMGKKAGDRVTVTAPAGDLHFEVKSVARAAH